MSITGLENPNSVAQLSGWLKDAGELEFSDLRKDTVASALKMDGVTGDAERMLRIRQELGSPWQ